MRLKQSVSIRAVTAGAIRVAPIMVTPTTITEAIMESMDRREKIKWPIPVLMPNTRPCSINKEAKKQDLFK